jgi:transposase-like protein
MLNAMTTRTPPNPQTLAMTALRTAQQRWARAKTAYEYADADRDKAVADARQAGVTWADIAEATKMHQPHAVRKWRRRLVHTVTLAPKSGRTA